MGDPGRMRVHGAPGFPRQHPGPARVIEMNVGGEDRRQVVNRKTQIGNPALHSFDGACRSALEEDESAVSRRRRKRRNHLAESLKSEVDSGQSRHLQPPYSQSPCVDNMARGCTV